MPDRRSRLTTTKATTSTARTRSSTSRCDDRSRPNNDPRGNGTVVRSSDSTGWRNRYCDAATENANVLTARSRPRTRSAPTPMSAARPAVSERGDHDGEQERAVARDRGAATPRSRFMPRVSAAATSAPNPANAICPSDSWPAHPVRTVSESPQIAKHDDRGVEQVPRGLRDQERQEDREQKERAQDDRVEPFRPTRRLRSRSGISRDLRRERERLRLRPGPVCGSGAPPRSARPRSSRPSMRPGLSR